MPRLFLSGLALLFCIQSATAAEFFTIPFTKGDGIVIVINGEIEHGDSQRFYTFVSQTRKDNHIKAISLNSRGGRIVESMKLAKQISAFDLPVFVGREHICSSACFLLFAAAKQKVAFVGSAIGVHQAGAGDTLLMTGAMAGFLRKCDVPEAIINKMISTPNDKIAWLDRADLIPMGVKIIEP